MGDGDQELPYVLVELDWPGVPHYEVHRNTLKNRVIERDGQIIHQFYNYSGWVNMKSGSGRIIDRFLHGKDAGRAKRHCIDIVKVMQS